MAALPKRVVRQARTGARYRFMATFRKMRLPFLGRIIGAAVHARHGILSPAADRGNVNYGSNGIKWAEQFFGTAPMAQDDAHNQDDREETPEERALAALRSGMARPQPKAPGEPAGNPSEESGVGSGSATGFVGMLAKRQLDGELTGSGIGDEAGRRSRYPLRMAREVVPPLGIEQPEVNTESPSVESPPVRWWYGAAIWVAWLLAILLVVIGAWAVGALIYMARHNGNSTPPIMEPSDVHYPLIAWRLNAGPLGDYTAASRIMAWMMLLCLPVAGLLLVIAGMLRRRMAGK
jgi:hypothetical protein